MNTLNKEKGFSLLEVSIVLIVLAISLLALAGLTATTIGNNSFAMGMTEAVTYAQDTFEELRARRWDTIPDGTNSDQPTGSTGVVYTRTWNAATNGNTKTITVTINWNDKINHTITLRSLISQ